MEALRTARQAASNGASRRLRREEAGRDSPEAGMTERRAARSPAAAAPQDEHGWGRADPSLEDWHLPKTPVRVRPAPSAPTGRYEVFNHYDTWALTLIDRALRAGHLSTEILEEIRSALRAAARVEAQAAGPDPIGSFDSPSSARPRLSVKY